MVASTESKITHDSLTITAQKLICGGMAGSVSKTLIAPLERVKILFQVNSPSYPYTGVISTLKRIAQREGFLGLYSGNASSVLRVFPYAAIQFVSFDFYQKIISNDGKNPSLFSNFAAGALAGATSVVFTYPLDVTRARLAVQISSERKQYNGLIHAFRHMWKHEGGIRAIFRGAGPTMIGIFPYAGINFFTYHSLKRYYITEWTDGGEIPTVIRLLFGSCAGIIGQTAVYPLDVIRRRMQIDGVKDGQSSYSYKYSSSRQAFLHIFRNEGWKMLFRGLHINYIKVVPLVSVSFTVNDVLRSYLGIKNVNG